MEMTYTDYQQQHQQQNYRMTTTSMPLRQSDAQYQQQLTLKSMLSGATARNPTSILGCVLSNFQSQGSTELTVWKGEEIFILFEINDWAFVTSISNSTRRGYIPLDYCDIVKDFFSINPAVSTWQVEQTPSNSMKSQSGNKSNAKRVLFPDDFSKLEQTRVYHDQPYATLPRRQPILKQPWPPGTQAQRQHVTSKNQPHRPQQYQSLPDMRTSNGQLKYSVPFNKTPKIQKVTFSQSGIPHSAGHVSPALNPMMVNNGHTTPTTNGSLLNRPPNQKQVLLGTPKFTQSPVRPPSLETVQEGSEADDSPASCKSDSLLRNTGVPDAYKQPADGINIQNLIKQFQLRITGKDKKQVDASAEDSKYTSVTVTPQVVITPPTPEITEPSIIQPNKYDTLSDEEESLSKEGQETGELIQSPPTISTSTKASNRSLPNLPSEAVKNTSESSISNSYAKDDQTPAAIASTATSTPVATSPSTVSSATPSLIVPININTETEKAQSGLLLTHHMSAHTGCCCCHHHHSHSHPVHVSPLGAAGYGNNNNGNYLHMLQYLNQTTVAAETNMNSPPGNERSESGLGDTGDTDSIHSAGDLNRKKSKSQKNMSTETRNWSDGATQTTGSLEDISKAVESQKDQQTSPIPEVSPFQRNSKFRQSSVARADNFGNKKTSSSSSTTEAGQMNRSRPSSNGSGSSTPKRAKSLSRKKKITEAEYKGLKVTPVDMNQNHRLTTASKSSSSGRDATPTCSTIDSEEDRRRLARYQGRASLSFSRSNDKTRDSDSSTPPVRSRLTSNDIILDPAAIDMCEQLHDSPAMTETTSSEDKKDKTNKDYIRQGDRRLSIQSGVDLSLLSHQIKEKLSPTRNALLRRKSICGPSDIRGILDRRDTVSTDITEESVSTRMIDLEDAPPVFDDEPEQQPRRLSLQKQSLLNQPTKNKRIHKRRNTLHNIQEQYLKLEEARLLHESLKQINTALKSPSQSPHTLRDDNSQTHTEQKRDTISRWLESSEFADNYTITGSTDEELIAINGHKELIETDSEIDDLVI